MKRIAPKSFSIKDAVSGKNEVKPTDNIESLPENGNVVEEIEEFNGDEVPDITEESLVNSWNKFAESVKDSNPSHSSLLKSYTPTMRNDFEIGIVFESQLQVDFFLEIKPNLLLYLRNQFKTKLLNIVESIEVQQNGSNRPYTVEDKFKFMIQKNPALAKMKQNLNLDFS